MTTDLLKVCRFHRGYFLSGDEDGTFVIDLTSFSPGPHSLIVMATSDEGEMDTADTIRFSVPAPLGMKLNAPLPDNQITL